MMFRITALCAALATALATAITILPIAAMAADKAALTRTVINDHILVRFAGLMASAKALEQAAAQDCTAESAALKETYHTAFDAWIGVSHLRFGPSEINDRAFALAFWPDPKGFTPRALRRLIDDRDPVATSVQGLADVSVAARGFYAMEFLLFDPVISTHGDADYRCDLVQALTGDIAANAAAIRADWTGTYADLLKDPGPDSRYRTEDEAVQELFKSLNLGLQFTSETRLGRPLGSLDRPRPKRAEARRSERSLRHVRLSLAALDELANLLTANNPELQARLGGAFTTSRALADRLDDPAFVGVMQQQGRIRVEALQSSINEIRNLASTVLGPSLGVTAGFNSLDGD